VADWFLERSPRTERLGLKFTGGYITFLGVVVVGDLYVNSQQFRPGQRRVLAPSDAWIGYGIGFALLIAGVATWHRRWRDLATATLAGVFAAILGFALPQTQSATVRERAPLLLGVIAVGLYCIRLFGGAYIPVPEPDPRASTVPTADDGPPHRDPT
jgi:drug/metabolite transporter (DMT)-like permease